MHVSHVRAHDEFPSRRRGLAKIRKFLCSRFHSAVGKTSSLRDLCQRTDRYRKGTAQLSPEPGQHDRKAGPPVDL